jgi:DNA-binding transcriptional ArsR family regulator
MSSPDLLAPRLDGDTLVLRDPRAIRALAHPVRLAVLDELDDETVERTATELASAAGVTPSAMSYHLRALARFGIVERGGQRSDGRDRPWHRVGRHLTLDSGQPNADAAAEMAFIDQMLVQLRSRWTALLASEQKDRQSLLSRERLWLTRDEIHALGEAISTAADQYLERRDATRRPVDAVDVELSWFLLPVVSDDATKDSSVR